MPCARGPCDAEHPGMEPFEFATLHAAAELMDRHVMGECVCFGDDPVAAASNGREGWVDGRHAFLRV